MNADLLLSLLTLAAAAANLVLLGYLLRLRLRRSAEAEARIADAKRQDDLVAALGLLTVEVVGLRRAATGLAAGVQNLGSDSQRLRDAVASLNMELILSAGRRGK